MDTHTAQDAPKRPRGRPRAFDRDRALDAAVLVFWERGYEGTSVANLTHAMGINRPSLYATFGNKRALFLEAIDRYAATHGSKAFSAFRLEPDIRKATETFFRESIDCALDDGTPRGCLINNVATDAAETDPELRAKLSDMFRGTDRAIGRRFTATDDNEESTTLPCEEMAAMVHSVTHSIMTRARAGADYEELTNLTDSFMAVLFPTPREPSTTRED